MPLIFTKLKDNIGIAIRLRDYFHLSSEIFLMRVIIVPDKNTGNDFL